jgi:2'-5' RNA ligase
MAIRSFLAFELTPEIKQIVSRVLTEAAQATRDVRWVRAAGIHLTVIFLGHVREEELSAIEDAAQRVCLNYRPFDVSLRGMGCFPNERNPRVIWLGLHGATERMSRFRDELQRGLEPFGVRSEKRPFRPHLTLGRIRKGRGGGGRGEVSALLRAYQDLTGVDWPLAELVLFKSDLRPNGAVYTKLKAWPLSGEE